MSERVIYVADADDRPVGGIRVLYRHVELLTKAGIDSAIWLPADRRTSRWFSSAAPVVSGPIIHLDETDTLIIPETCVVAGSNPAPGCRQIIYNQNQFLTFMNAPSDEYPSWDPRSSLWVSSLASYDVLIRLQKMLPVTRIDYIPLAIDTQLFRPSRIRERKIAWMPRKRPHESALLFALLTADDRFKGVRLSSIDDLSEEDTAAELGSTSIFIAFGREEGFGLPVAEALAAGCAVVGYPGGGGAELFRGPGTYEIPDSDILAIVEQVAAILGGEPTDDERLAYRSWIKEMYPESGQRARLIQAIASARKQPAYGGKATHPLGAGFL